MKKRVLTMTMGLLLLGGAGLLPAQAATTVAQTAVSQEDFWFGVRTAQGDVAYYQQAVNDGSLPYDTYQEYILQMRATASQRAEDPGLPIQERDYYRGYLEGLAFA